MKPPDLIEASATAALPEVVAEVLADKRPSPESEVLDAQWRFDIEPKLKSLGFDERFRREILTWNNAKQEEFFRICEKTLCGVGAIVALVGIRGTGKTTIAAQLAIARIRAWLDFYHRMPEERIGVPRPRGLAYYSKATDLVSKFKPLYADYGCINAESLTNAREYQCREWSLLVVDEMHETDEQDMRDRVLTDIIDRRYSNLTDTLLISNQTAADFRATTNSSVLSRLTEHGCIIECNWRSWRVA